MMRYVPVIMAGGRGARLWPASAHGRRKPFLRVLGERTLIAETADRLMSDESAASQGLVICGRDDADAARAALEPYGDFQVLAEPAAKGTAAAVAAAAWRVHELFGGETGVVISPADHAVGDRAAFHEAIRRSFAHSEGLWVLGARPTEPSTSYGYVTPALSGGLGPVAAFLEKPAVDVARELIDQGALWNAGVFLGAAKHIISELERHAPDISQAARRALPTGRHEEAVLRLGACYADAPDAPFDKAVMEKTSKAYVAPVDMGWSDVGDWTTVSALTPANDAGHRVRARHAEVRATNSRNCFVDVDGSASVRLEGVADLVLVRRGRSVLLMTAVGARHIRAAAAFFDDRDQGVFRQDVRNVSFEDAEGGPAALLGLDDIVVRRTVDGALFVGAA